MLTAEQNFERLSNIQGGAISATQDIVKVYQQQLDRAITCIFCGVNMGCTLYKPKSQTREHEVRVFQGSEQFDGKT